MAKVFKLECSVKHHNMKLKRHLGLTIDQKTLVILVSSFSPPELGKGNLKRVRESPGEILS